MFVVLNINSAMSGATFKVVNKTVQDTTQLVKMKHVITQESETKFQIFIRNLFALGFFTLLIILIITIFLFNKKIKKVNAYISNFDNEYKDSLFEIEKFSTILNNTENSVMIYDKEGLVEWINIGCKSLFGYSIDNIKHKEKYNLFSYNINDKIKIQIENCKKTKESTIYTNSIEDEFLNKVWYQRSLIPILRDNEIVLYAAIDSDLTMTKIAMGQIKRQKKKVEEQRNIAIEQKKEIEKQKKKITDSINYASYIQSAVLPPMDIMDSILPNRFILFKPRDVVSGDFYWLTKVDEKIIVVAADCTGHGVPGAFMSMLGITFLNEIINAINDDNFVAGIILDKLREYVINSLHQTKESSTKDGMDLSLCILDYNEMKMQYAGAYNPLYYFKKNNNNETEFVEIKGDRMPIGIHIRQDNKFTNNVINVNKGDTFYLFSDGYADQLGGERKRKFLSKNFKILLAKIQNETLENQKQILNKTMVDWMGEYEQIDDIVVIGIKI